MKEVGLYFGTFNPIHVGHLIIADYMACFTELDEVWLVVTPHNPHKPKSGLLEDYHRYALAQRAVEDNPRLRVSDVEFKLPKPSFTTTTLAHLGEKYPDRKFALIMGEDNLRTLHKWKNPEIILERHKIYVYPRSITSREKKGDTSSGTTHYSADHPAITVVDAPVMNISSSFVRRAIKEGLDVRYILTDPVYRYVREMHFYEK